MKINSVANGSPTILIIDDTRTNRALLEGVLRPEGFRTISARGGVTGRAVARAEQPDLILLDILMPGETGFETCSQLKSEPRTADIPIIFLSALDDVQSKLRGLKIGGVDYIAKPVHGEEVLARIRIHLRIQETNRALVREYRTRMESLRAAQQAILVQPEDCPEATFAVHNEPFEETGGDFYDVVPVKENVVGYFVADVSGHGTSAAFLTSAIKALLRQYSGPLYSPEDSMRGVNAVMRQLLGQEQYLTACYAHLNQRTRKLTVVNAGHPPLIRVTGLGEAEVVEMNSDPLGIFSSFTLQRKDLRVSIGDRFYMYSDGILESQAGGDRKSGLEKLVDACIEHRTEPLASVPEKIASRLRAGVQAEDDLLLMAVEVSR